MRLHPSAPTRQGSSLTKAAEHNASATDESAASSLRDVDASEEEEGSQGVEGEAEADPPTEEDEGRAAAGAPGEGAGEGEDEDDAFQDAVAPDVAPVAEKEEAKHAVEGEEGEEEDGAAAAVATVSQELSGPETVRRQRAETGGNMKKDKYNAKMQWLITNKMKKVLREELHYEAAEVEAMMPDVAAVVINKHLERPKRGMPAEWRKDFHLRRRGWDALQAGLVQAARRLVEEPRVLLRQVGLVAVAAVGAGAARRWMEARRAGEEEEEWEWVEMTPWEEFVDRWQRRLPGRGRGARGKQ